MTGLIEAEKQDRRDDSLESLKQSRTKVLPLLVVAKWGCPMPDKKILIKMPTDIIPIFTKKEEELANKIKELAVIELFREGKISSGKAADILGMQRFEFIRYISRQGIPYFDMDKEELERDIFVAMGKAR